MKYDMYELPESLYEFAQISDFHGVIEDLAAMAEDEDWNYHNTTSTSDLPILENYIRKTYIRLSREKKLHILRTRNFVALTQAFYLELSMCPYICSSARIQILALIVIGISLNFLEKANMKYGNIRNYQKWHFIGTTQQS